MSTRLHPFAGRQIFLCLLRFFRLRDRFDQIEVSTHQLPCPAAFVRVVPRVTGDFLEFTLDKPQDLSIEPNGPNSPLLLFTNPPEENTPNAGDPNVI